MHELPKLDDWKMMDDLNLTELLSSLDVADLFESLNPPEFEIDQAALDRLWTDLVSGVAARHAGKSYRLRWAEDNRIEIRLDDYVTLEIRGAEGGLELRFAEKSVTRK